MVKFIGYWMFASHIWSDAQPSPVAINTREISKITEMNNERFGMHIAIHLKNGTIIPIEGDIIDVLAKFQEHLINY